MATLTIDGVDIGVLSDGPVPFHLQSLAQKNGLGEVLDPRVTVQGYLEHSPLFAPGMAKSVLETRVEIVIVFRQFNAVAVKP